MAYASRMKVSPRRTSTNIANGNSISNARWSVCDTPDDFNLNGNNLEVE
jgi:hypothetical protein